MIEPVASHTPITVENGKLVIPHLGITLRSLHGAAIANIDSLQSSSKTRCNFSVEYKSANVATIKLGRDFKPKIFA